MGKNFIYEAESMSQLTIGSYLRLYLENRRETEIKTESCFKLVKVLKYETA